MPDIFSEAAKHLSSCLEIEDPFLPLKGRCVPFAAMELEF